MPLLPILTQPEEDLLLIDNLILFSAEATHHLAATMTRCNAELWSLPDERLAAVLNSDPSRTAAIFAANSALGQAINSALDSAAVPSLTARCPLFPGREISVDSSGSYLVIPRVLPPDLSPPLPAAPPIQ